MRTVIQSQVINTWNNIPYAMPLITIASPEIIHRTKLARSNLIHILLKMLIGKCGILEVCDMIYQ